MAQDLVDHGRAATVSLNPVQTFFRFDGQTVEEVEVQLVVVTTLARHPEVEARILALHTYEVPDVLMVPAAACSGPAAAWIRQCTGS